MDRKQFLKRCAALAAGAALGGSLPGCAPLPYVAYTLDADDRATIQIANFGERGFVLLDVPTLPAPVYVRRLDDGYAALLLRCTHRGCKVDPGAAQLQCPCHGSRYTPLGEVVEGPAPRALRRFRVSTTADAVRVHLREREKRGVGEAERQGR